MSVKSIPNNITQKQLTRLHNGIGLDPLTGCWPWLCSFDKDGYGRTSLFGINYQVHRVVYKIATGIDPGELIVRHKCDNPPCCNPAHLLLGTNADNVKDRDIRKRTAKGTRNGAHTHPEKIRRGSDHPLRKDPSLAARGSKNGFSKLTEDQVKELRCLRKHEKLSFKELAKMFNIKYVTVSAIVRNLIWKHVT